jgi:hypothetical protein
MAKPPKVRNRRDHILPRGYLRGFIDSSGVTSGKELWTFDIHAKEWSLKSPAEVGWEWGFYDYSKESEVQTGTSSGDVAFTELEQQFPIVRRSLLESGFHNWTEHQDFLLRFMQMMRVRSALFFAQQIELTKAGPLAIIEEVISERELKIRYVGASEMPAALFKNQALTQMRQEIEQEPNFFEDFDWALRFTDSPSDPFVTTESPVGMIGKGTDSAKAIDDSETLFFFPICWQACLIGSRRHFHVKTDQFCSADLRSMRRILRENAKSFLVSPTKLEVW